MVIELQFIPTGMVDPVKLRQRIVTLVQADIDAGTLMASGDSGSITLAHATNGDFIDEK